MSSKSEDAKTWENFSYLLRTPPHIKWISKMQKWSAEMPKSRRFRSSAIRRLYGQSLPLMDVGSVGTIESYTGENELESHSY